jgi:excisionase family DNA binding protein
LPTTLNPRRIIEEVLYKPLYRVPEAMELLCMSRAVIYEQLRSGRLRSVKQGRSRRVPAKAIMDYVALLEREAEGGTR